ncbi:MAG: hypothetical protein AAGE98_05420 [Actinomycetota bacterium]
METPAVLEAFVETCKRAVKGDDARATIHAAMTELFADPATLAAGIPAFAAADVETSPRGFRLGGEALLHQAADLSVMVLGTLPGVVQPPHDHEMVAMIGVFEGCEEQRFWARTDDGIEPAAGRMLEAGEVMVLGERTIHAISSPPHEDARAIHVYLGDIYAIERSVFDPDTLQEHPMTSERYDEFCRPA